MYPTLHTHILETDKTWFNTNKMQGLPAGGRVIQPKASLILSIVYELSVYLKQIQKYR
jgi:hypothetical protein